MKNLAVHFTGVLMVSMVFASTGAAAPQTCFKDKESWEKSKDKLPALLQNMPLRLVHADGSTMLTGAMAIDWSEAKKAFKLDFYGHHRIVQNQSDTGVITNVCVSADRKTITVSNNGGTKTLDLLSDTKVSIQDYVFTIEPDERKFARVVTQVQSLNRPATLQAFQQERSSGIQ